MIKEVSYERLFSFGQYENEKIRFGAVVEGEESPEKTLGNLVLKISEIEDALNQYRRLLHDVEYAEGQVERADQSICRTKDEMERMKVKIDEIIAHIEKGDADYDSRMRHACDRQSYKELAERLPQQEEELAKAGTYHKQAILARDELKKRIKEGNFSIEGVIVVNPRSKHFDEF